MPRMNHRLLVDKSREDLMTVIEQLLLYVAEVGGLDRVDKINRMLLQNVFSFYKSQPPGLIISIKDTTMEKVFIYNELLGLKGSLGVLQQTNERGYYDLVIKIKENRHRILLPIAQTVIIFSEPIIEMDHSLDLE